MLDRLVFLPEIQVRIGIQYLITDAPNGFAPLVHYFDETYLSGKYHRTSLRILPPTFEPAIWNVNESTLSDSSGTNNICESRNIAFNHIVGYKNATIWACIECLKNFSMLSYLALRNHQRDISLKNE